MSAHTPGPWVLADDGSAFVYAPNRPTDSRDWCNRFHARVDAGYDENDQRTQAAEMLANARLIAAAPDLLWITSRLATLAEGLGNGNSGAEAAAWRLAEEAHAVITKVQGDAS